MQNAKDSFYEVLRGRLQSLNPDRTAVVRGVTRPGLVVDENETQSVAPMPDCFHLRWTGVDAMQEGALPLIALNCEISYATAGSAWNGGLDRGRALAAMDGELMAATKMGPQYATKSNYSGVASGAAPALMGTKIWWSDASFEKAESKAEQISRVVKLQVMSYQEAGEL